MNILYITNHLNTGGITSYVLRLGAALKARGHNIYVASSGGDMLAEFIKEGLHYLPIPIRTKCEVSPKVFFSLLKLLPLVKSEEIGLIHSNSRTTQVLGALVSNCSGIPHMSTCHGFFKKRFFRRAFPCWGRQIIAISAEVNQHLIDDFKVDGARIKLINHGVDTQMLRRAPLRSLQDIRQEFGLNSSGPVVGNIGRLSGVKGQEYLIRAMKEVLRQLPDSRLLIIGEGRMKQGLINLAESLGIAEKVLFAAKARQMNEALAAMDIFVMPSIKEGLGLALMDAMAAGKCVVASGVGGIKTLIQEGFNGLLVPPGDPDRLAAAVLRLLRNPEESRRLGANARDFIEKNFPLTKMAKETEEVYSGCIG